MKKSSLKSLTTEELVQRYAEIGVEQSDPSLIFQTMRFNRLFDEHMTIAEELKRRNGDQRRALMSLYSHPNFQTRLNAAKETLAIAPAAARAQIEAIAASKHYPEAGDAGMCLWTLDEGIFKPT